MNNFEWPKFWLLCNIVSQKSSGKWIHHSCKIWWNQCNSISHTIDCTMHLKSCIIYTLFFCVGSGKTTIYTFNMTKIYPEEHTTIIITAFLNICNIIFPQPRTKSNWNHQIRGKLSSFIKIDLLTCRKDIPEQSSREIQKCCQQ